jgi:hypothetical protein
MLVLFVHGMGRTPVSGWPLLRRLRQAKMKTATFAYSAAFADFDTIALRLGKKIERVAASDNYVIVGHSLGGVLVRSALSQLAYETRLPAHVYLLGSPVQATRLAARLKHNFIFRLFTGDCGQLLGSTERMGSVPPLQMPTTSIVGVRGLSGPHSPFGLESNDGVVSISEASATWLSSQVQVPVMHTLLPSSTQVADIVMHGVCEIQD